MTISPKGSEPRKDFKEQKIHKLFIIQAAHLAQSYFNDGENERKGSTHPSPAYFRLWTVSHGFAHLIRHAMSIGAGETREVKISRFGLIAATFFVAALASSVGRAAVVIDSFGTYIQDFTGYTAFDAAAHPTGWTTTFDSAAFRGFTSDGSTIAIAGSSGGSITSGGLFSWGEALPGPAVGASSFAWQGTGSSANMVSTATFTNNTGKTIKELTVSFDVLQWRQGAGGTGGGRASTLDLASSANVLGLNSFNFTAAAPGANNPAVGRAFNTASPAAFTADTSFNQTLTGLSIASGDNFSFSFTYNRGLGSGSAQGIALDNFSVTAVPEPSSMAVLALIGGVGAYRARHRLRGRSAEATV